jgi:hypothetical protein
MASEILAVPEENLEAMIEVIRVGLTVSKIKGKVKIPRDMERGLKKWCKEEEEYLKRLNTPD